MAFKVSVFGRGRAPLKVWGVDLKRAWQCENSYSGNICHVPLQTWAKLAFAPLTWRGTPTDPRARKQRKPAAA